MTNEYAKKVLTELRGYGDKFANIGFDRKEALDMAIKALEQQPCEDAISRQEAISAIQDEYYADAVGIDIVDIIANLPSVTPTISEKETVEDCISRDAVDEYITKLLSGYLYDEERTRLEDLTAYIWELPSVIPQPCEEAISRQAVMNIISFEYGWLIDAKEYNTNIRIAFNSLMSKVKALPSVTPTRPTGKWIEKEDYNLDTYYECSECGADYCIEGDILIHKYCPNCGAKMNGVETEVEDEDLPRSDA